MFIDDPHMNRVLELAPFTDSKAGRMWYRLVYSVVQRHGMRYEWFVS